MAVQILLEGKGNRVISVQTGRLMDLDMEEALSMTKTFDMSLYSILESLTNGVSQR